jgi:hypothetical protein
LPLLITATLLASVEIREARANPTVRIYVDMPPQGYIPGIPVGQVLKVAINIESPTEWRDTANGIAGWAFFVQVDPEVLEPLGVKSAMSGCFLCDFAQMYGYSTNLYYMIDKGAGIFWDVAEFIQGYGMLGVGAGGDGKLCELWFKSKSQTAYTSIDIYHWTPSGVCHPRYWTPDGQWHPFDVVEDGQYNVLEPPTLPTTTDVVPDTLNLHGRGRWIAAYIQLPEEHNPEEVDATTILLNETIQPVLDLQYGFVTDSSEYLVDRDGDGILERLVKFNRTEVASWICDDLGIQYGNVTLAIAGELHDGTPFEGIDKIKVVLPGDVDDDGDVDRYDFGLFSDAYATNVNDFTYNWAADFDEDQVIDRYDFGILADYYGKTAV